MSLLYPCPEVITINRTDCIGNSRTVINDNFQILKESICTNITTLSDLDDEKLRIDTQVFALSSQLLPGTAKAWVKFDGTRDTGDLPSTIASARKIRSSYNVVEVFRTSTGVYRVNFQFSMRDKNYATVATSSQTVDSAGNYTWAQPARFERNWVEVHVHSLTPANPVDPQHVSVVVF